MGERRLRGEQSTAARLDAQLTLYRYMVASSLTTVIHTVEASSRSLTKGTALSINRPKYALTCGPSCRNAGRYNLQPVLP